jgi:hypothetical protein
LRPSPTSGPGSPTAVQDATDAASVAKAIAEFKSDPNLGNRVTKDSKQIRAILARDYPNFNLGTAITDWNNKEKFNTSENSQRFITARTAIGTFKSHLADYEQFNKNFDEAYKRSPYRMLNRGIMWTALNGLLGPEAAGAAAQLEANKGPLSIEFAVILAGGFRPQNIELKDAHNTISTLWSPKQQGKAILAIKRLVNGRAKSMNAQVPHSGAKTNQYLQDATMEEPYPGLDSGDAAAAPAGGRAEKHRIKGAK